MAGCYGSVRRGAEWVADAKAVLDGAGVAHAVVVGWSLGGRIAQCLALDRPDRVDALVLISTDFGGPERLPMLPGAAPLFAPPPGTTAEAYPHAAYSELPACGHFPPIEEPGRVVEAIERFLDARP